MFNTKAIAIAALTLTAATLAAQAGAQAQGMAQPQNFAGYCKGVLVPQRFYHTTRFNAPNSSRDSFFLELRNAGVPDVRYVVAMTWSRGGSTVEKRVTAEVRTLKGVTTATIPLGEVVTRMDMFGGPPSDADIKAATTVTCN